MEFTFYFDKNIGKKHIYKHNITVEEINEFFTESNYLRRKRKDGSFVAIGKLKNGRNLEVVYRELEKHHFFIITAYDIEEDNLINLLEDL
jgi:uncharacterized DUF497 family protein